jgi:secreted trypsin-like serine protease
LKRIRSLENRFIPLAAIFKSGQSSIQALSTLHATRYGLSEQNAGAHIAVQRCFEELERETTSYGNNVAFLLKKAKSTGQSISDTLNIKFQATSQELTHAAQQDSVAIRVITVVTLLYLPFTFVAVSLFGCMILSRAIIANDGRR